MSFGRSRRYRLDFRLETRDPPDMAENVFRETAQAALIREMQRVQRLHAERAGNPILSGALTRLSGWQSQRLRMTYADLAAQPRYAAAVEFFLRDLYGPVDFSQRDADLARVVPMMVRMLPASVLVTTTAAVELNGLSQELDRALLARLPRADGQLTVIDYCKAYRRIGNFPLRRRQIDLIREIGSALDRQVRRTLLRAALLLMRQPARLAGMAALQDFLERGFEAFRRMGGAAHFLETIHGREMAICDAIIDGASTPFPDPLTFRLPPRAPPR